MPWWVCRKYFPLCLKCAAQSAATFARSYSCSRSKAITRREHREETSEWISLGHFFSSPVPTFNFSLGWRANFLITVINKHWCPFILLLLHEETEREPGSAFLLLLFYSAFLSLSHSLRAPGGSLLYSRGNKSSFARDAHAPTARPPKLPGVNVAEPRCSKFAALRSVSSFTPEIARDSWLKNERRRERKGLRSASDSKLSLGTWAIGLAASWLRLTHRPPAARTLRRSLSLRPALETRRSFKRAAKWSFIIWQHLQVNYCN